MEKMKINLKINVISLRKNSKNKCEGRSQHNLVLMKRKSIPIRAELI